MKQKRHILFAVIASSALITTGFLFQSGCSSCGGCLSKNKEAETKLAFDKSKSKSPSTEFAPIDVSNFNSDKKVRDLVFELAGKPNQIKQRIGDHHQHYTAEMSFTGVKEKTLTLFDDYTLTTGDRNDFYIVRDDKETGKGFEMWWIGDTLYSGNKGGPYHGRRGDLFTANRFRKAAYHTLVSILELYGDSVQYLSQGSDTQNGQPCVRLSVSLKPDIQPAKPVTFDNTEAGKEKEKETAELESANTPFGLEAFKDKGKPVSIKGDIWLGEGNGVIIKSVVEGEILVGKQFTVKYDFNYKSNLDTRGEFKPFVPPQEIPAPRATKVPTDPLEFYHTEQVPQAPEKRSLTDKPAEPEK